MPATQSIEFDPNRYTYAPHRICPKQVCPYCQDRRRTFTPFLDTYTGEVLPDTFGHCDRPDSCGFYNDPRKKEHSADGQSYAFKVYLREKGEQKETEYTSVPRSRPAPAPAQPICSIPSDLMQQSLTGYEHNQLYKLLQAHFGGGVADELIARFQIGTSAYWPGACVFWYVDEKRRVRGGQIVSFKDDWHKHKYTDAEGKTRPCINWVQWALKVRYQRKGESCPEWLTAYLKSGQSSPCLFGLPQLASAPATQPVAIVEAAKTAILCTPYMPENLWMSVGGLSYLNAERLAPLKGRKILLWPDASVGGKAYADWSGRAEKLKAQGFKVEVMDFLERKTTAEEKAAGFDLADYLLQHWPGYPPSWDSQ